MTIRINKSKQRLLAQIEDDKFTSFSPLHKQEQKVGSQAQENVYKYVLTSDIEKMYRFIMVHPEHKPLQKIVWRSCPQQVLREYQLCTVTYGTKAAPFLALRTLQQLAMDEGDKYPEAKNILLNQFFRRWCVIRKGYHKRGP